MKKTMIGIALALLALAGCRQKDVREFDVDVPALTAANEDAVRRAISGCTGVIADSLKFDLANHRVTVRYDSMQTAKKNIEFAVAKVGLEANGVKPEQTTYATNSMSNVRH